MELWLVATTAAAAWLLYRAVCAAVASRRLPPGPPSLPLVGGFFFMTFPLRQWYRESKNRYGPIASFRMNGRLFVSLNTYEAIREAFVVQGNAFAGRPQHIFTDRVFKNSGLVMSEGPLWRQHRRFSLQALRDFGFGKIASEDSILKEAADLTEALEAAAGQPIRTGVPFGKAVSNVICRLVFNRRVATEDPDFDKKLMLVTKITQSAPDTPTLRVTLLMPLITNLAPALLLRMPQLKRMVGMFESLFAFFQEEIDKKKANYDTTDEPGDYIEAYLSERQRLQERSPEQAAQFFGDKKLQVSISDLFLAGTDTTTNSLGWAALHLAIDPDLQERLRRHVLDAIGRRTPKMSDKTALPLLESFLLESQRYYTLVPTGVQHRTLEDVTLFGFSIPKHSTVTANIQVVHADAANFPEPQKFIADRFIDAGGKFAPSERVIPFSIGKRSCLGESLARMELFLFAAVLLQNFKITLPEAEASRLREILVGTDGAIRAPVSHELVFEKLQD